MSASPGRLPARPSARVWDPPGRGARVQQRTAGTRHSPPSARPWLAPRRPCPSPTPDLGRLSRSGRLRRALAVSVRLGAREEERGRPRGAQVGGERGSLGSARSGREGRPAGPEPKSSPALRGEGAAPKLPFPILLETSAPRSEVAGGQAWSWAEQAGRAGGGGRGPALRRRSRPATPHLARRLQALLVCGVSGVERDGAQAKIQHWEVRRIMESSPRWDLERILEEVLR